MFHSFIKFTYLLVELKAVLSCGTTSSRASHAASSLQIGSSVSSFFFFLLRALQSGAVFPLPLDVDDLAPVFLMFSAQRGEKGRRSLVYSMLFASSSLSSPPYVVP